MMRRRVCAVASLVMVVVLTLSAVLAVNVAADEPVYHTVLWGQSLSWIAYRYGVTLQEMVEANGLSNPNVIYAGQRLLIPTPAREYTEHVVSWGESLLTIAARYGVSVWEIAASNGIANINLIFVGQRFRIPSGALPEAEPTRELVQEAIVIASPEDGSEVDSPVTVTGWGSGYDNKLAVDVLDEFGSIIGQGFVTVDAEPGECGPFMGAIELDQAGSAGVGRVQVYSISASDGAIEHLASVSVSAGESETPPELEATPPATEEAVIITSPAPRIAVSSPVTVTGWGSAFENTLGVDVLDEVGMVIGQGYVIVDAEFGQRGPFTGSIDFTPPASAQIGRIQVYNISPRDGAIEHLNSILVDLLP